jgi:hypothetical protein
LLSHCLSALSPPICIPGSEILDPKNHISAVQLSLPVGTLDGKLEEEQGV